ncbi:hypothetical protein BSKO_06206 [Bryopsis sp. KO-2023]|nr:hypothetical protein BSKO_06206 [Bryopsis sp. KO-2023]
MSLWRMMRLAFGFLLSVERKRHRQLDTAEPNERPRKRLKLCREAPSGRKRARPSPDVSQAAILRPGRENHKKRVRNHGSTLPMRKRNIRKKGGLIKDERSSDALELSTQPSAATKPKKKESKNLLSFDEDEEPVVTVIKKTQDQRHFRRRGAVDKTLSQTSTQMPSAGEYTAEALNALKKSTPRMPPSKKEPPGPGKDGQRPIIKLSGSFKPNAPKKDERFEIGTASLLVTDMEQKVSKRQTVSDIDLPPPPGPPPRAAQKKEEKEKEQTSTATVSQTPVEAPSLDDDEVFIPPDDKTIRMAKAKRERLRQAHLAPDYLPLGGTSTLLSQDYKRKESGQDSDSGEEREEDMRMAFVSNAGHSKAGKSRTESSMARPMESLDGSPSVEEDEDDDEFVRAQIRKGIGMGGGPEEKPGNTESREKRFDPSRSFAQGLPVVSSGMVASNAEQVLLTLQKDLERLKVSKKQAEQNLNRIRGSLREALEDVGNLKSNLDSAGEKYRSFQEMKVYIADLCDCLQSKSVLVEELESHMKRITEDRAEEKHKKRKAMDTEDMQIAEASVSTALATLSRGQSSALAIIAADSATEEAEGKLLTGSGHDGVDEFGRSLKMMHQREAGERSAARKARWTRVRREGKIFDFELGASSDESDGENDRFVSRCGEVVQTASTVFADADPEYGSLSEVKKCLETWKFHQQAGYRDAYLSMSIPALFAPFVRLEMLQWCPIYGGGVGLEGFGWYRELESYGQSFIQSAGEGDTDLVPELVSKIVLPIATQLITRCWAPGSFRQSRAVSEILRELLVYVPADNPGLHDLIVSITDQLTQAVESLRIPPWPQAAINVSIAAESVIGIRLRRALKTIAGVCCFDDVLPKNVVRGLVLETMLGRKLLGCLRGGVGDGVGSVQRIHTILHLMPQEWFSGGVPVEAPYLPELLSSIARSLENQRVEALTQGQQDVVQSAAKLANLFARIGEHAAAAKLRNTFRVAP